MVSVGTIIWLSSELMFFAALFASYFTIRAVSPELWSEMTAELNVPFASANTTILVLSSLTCQLGVFAAEGLGGAGVREPVFVEAIDERAAIARGDDEAGEAGRVVGRERERDQ